MKPCCVNCKHYRHIKGYADIDCSGNLDRVAEQRICSADWSKQCTLEEWNLHLARKAHYVHIRTRNPNTQFDESCPNFKAKTYPPMCTDKAFYEKIGEFVINGDFDGFSAHMTGEGPEEDWFPYYAFWAGVLHAKGELPNPPAGIRKGQSDD